MTILGIETSCDDTAAAVVEAGTLRSNVVSSQMEHDHFGGVVPELASRIHQRAILPVVREALAEAECTPEELDGIAVTYGPGLAGSLLVGLSFAKAYAFGLGLPLVGVNHLEGHLYSVLIEEERPAFPFLCLIVSGGHTQLVRVEEGFRHQTLGRTRDDAAGEAFDKVGKLLGLGYPGGPEVDRLAREGDPAFHDFPRSRPGGLDFSFSGLKTSVLYYLNDVPAEEREQFLSEHRADLCASVQQAIVDVLVGALERAVDETGIDRVAVVGGVSANSQLRERVDELAERKSLDAFVPPLAYCTDNAAMIATTGYYKLRAGQTSPLDLGIAPSLRLSSL